MNDIVKTVDVKELGRRFKLIRRRLGLTQVKVAKEMDTSQLMIFRVEKGENVLSPLILGLLLFYSQSVSLDALLAKQFDIDDDNLFNKNYSLNTIVKAKLDILRDEILSQLAHTSKKLEQDLVSASDLL